jgi:uncharacterized protein YbaP (TraB family)
MRTYTSKLPSTTRPAKKTKQELFPMQLLDQRPEALAQQEMQDMINGSDRVRQMTYPNNRFEPREAQEKGALHARQDAMEGYTTQLKAHPSTSAHQPDPQPSNPVQMMKPDDLALLGKEIDLATATDAQAALSPHLWRLSLPSGAVIYVVGTVHSSTMLVEMAKAQKEMPESKDQVGNTPVARLLHFISTTEFSSVHTEIHAELPALEKIYPPLDLLSEPNRSSQKAQWAKYIKRMQNGDGLNVEAMDDVLASLAIREKGDSYHALETEETRNAATLTNYKDAGGQEAVVPQGWEARLPNEANDDLIAAYRSGNEQGMWAIHAEALKKGLDPQGIEARNDQWVAKLEQEAAKYDAKTPALWIVGASHIPGLLVRFRKQKLAFEKVPI